MDSTEKKKSYSFNNSRKYFFTITQPFINEFTCCEIFEYFLTCILMLKNNFLGVYKTTTIKGM